MNRSGIQELSNYNCHSCWIWQNHMHYIIELHIIRKRASTRWIQYEQGHTQIVRDICGNIVEQIHWWREKSRQWTLICSCLDCKTEEKQVQLKLLITEETLHSNQKEFDILKEQNNEMHETSIVNTFYIISFIEITYLFFYF